jgi:Tfp pilus assembly protein PilV
MKRLKRVQAGISMLEIVITLFIVMLGLLVVMASFLAISKSQRFAGRMEVANTLAKYEMEKIRNKAFDNIINEVGTYSEYSEHPGFRHEVTVTQSGSLKEIVLHIYFEDDRRQAIVRTYVSNL